jgi:uncharacterized membrane protein
MGVEDGGRVAAVSRPTTGETMTITSRVRRGATLAAIMASAVTVPAVTPHSPVVGTAAAACTKVRVAGATKCLAPGQFCARRYQSDYKRAGFVCARGSDGRDRLRYR